MKPIYTSGLNLFQFDKLSAFPDIIHFVSTRHGGVSPSPFNFLNLSYKVGDDSRNVAINRGLLAKSLGVISDHLIFPSQTHSCNVKVLGADAKTVSLEDTDGLVTDQKGICLAVMSADCVPLLFYDPVKKVIGTAHAGWKGTLGKIGVNIIQTMQERFGSDVTNIRVGIGPSISPEAYEVSADVFTLFENKFGQDAGLVQKTIHPGKGYLDLWKANLIQLLEAGVPENQVEIAGLCTYKSDDLFYSYRKSAIGGRFAAGIVLKK